MKLENLKIEKTKDTFEISCECETGIIEINGTSYPENALEFFEPVLDWVEEYCNNSGKKEITLNMNVNYLNSSTTKCILDIFEEVETFVKKGNKGIINWYYKKNDKIIRNSGEEFLEDLVVPFKLIEY